MSLSLFLILLLPLFLVPAFLLPQNKLRFFTLASSTGVLLILVLTLTDVFFPDTHLMYSFGAFFYPMFAPFLNRPELNQEEIYHLSAFFAFAFLYGVCYLLTYIPLKIFYIGSNPYLKAPLNKVRRAVEIILYLGMSYALLFFFFVEVREILPFQDGFMKDFFQAVYPIEA